MYMNRLNYVKRLFRSFRKCTLKWTPVSFLKHPGGTMIRTFLSIVGSNDPPAAFTFMFSRFGRDTTITSKL